MDDLFPKNCIKRTYWVLLMALLVLFGVVGETAYERQKKLYAPILGPKDTNPSKVTDLHAQPLDLEQLLAARAKHDESGKSK